MIDTAPLRRKLLDLAITGKLVPGSERVNSTVGNDTLMIEYGH